MTTLHLRKSVSHSLSLITFHYSLLTVLLLALSPVPQAFGVSPPPDGGYPNRNTAEGDSALLNLTTGSANTANGFQALVSDTAGSQNAANGAFALAANTTGNNNTANGFAALYNNMSGSKNTANGVLALYNNTTGDNNTANGLEALFSNTTGAYNTANGVLALFSNIHGNLNTANGFAALYSNIDGVENTANGYQALYSNTNGGSNTATGLDALYSNTEGTYNTAVGWNALFSNTGSQNTAYGADALLFNSTGNNNTATGIGALLHNRTGVGNTAIGNQALYNNTGSYNVALNGGYNLTTGIFNIDIANDGVAGESYTTRIGILQTRAFISGIYGVMEGGTMSAVYINSDGQLGTQAPPSSRRFKKEIKPMDQTSQAILGLQPVTFQYKSDPSGTAQFGLIAEEVAQVNPDLVVRDAEGEIYSVRYEAVNAMLLNEFLKEHRMVQEQGRKAQEQEATIAKQQKQIDALTAGLQRVSAQVEMNRPAPQMVINNQ